MYIKITEQKVRNVSIFRKAIVIYGNVVSFEV